MIDIHNHILCGIDDGADSLNESIELCKMGYENNFDDIFVTPHYYFNMSAEEFVMLRDRRLGELREALTGIGLELQLHPGAEVFVSEDLIHAQANDLRRLALGNTNYILVEFPFEGFATDTFWSMLDLFFDARLCPIIAHLERYEIFQREPRLGIEAARKGIALQVNIGSPAGLLGVSSKQCAERLLMLECVSFLATDAHNIRYRNNEITDIYNRLASRMPSTSLYSLLEDNPRALLQNKFITTKYFNR